MMEDDRQAAVRFGAAVRTAREARGLTLAGLATASAVSRAMLSKVERGEKSPTLPVAGRIARGLGLGLSRLLGAEPAASALVVTRRGDRVTFRDAKTGMVRELLSPAADGPGVEVARHAIPANKGSGELDAYPPGTRKYVVVEVGRLLLRAGEWKVELGPGDAAYFEADLPHSFTNPSVRPCAYLLVVSRGRG